MEVAALGLLTASLFSTSAYGVVLCARPRTDGTFNTTVRIREACKANEVQLNPGALGLQGPAGPRGPGLVVKDTGGIVVGAVLDAWSSPNIQIQSLSVARDMGSGQVDVLRLTRDGIVDDGNPSFIYESPDCTGQAYLDISASPQPILGIAVTHGGTTYYQAASGSLVSRGSARVFGIGDAATCATAYGGTWTAPDQCCYACLPPSECGPAVRAPGATTTLGFVPPFRVEAQ
jgi:hypothetical protein